MMQGGGIRKSHRGLTVNGQFQGWAKTLGTGKECIFPRSRWRQANSNVGRRNSEIIFELYLISFLQTLIQNPGHILDAGCSPFLFFRFGKTLVRIVWDLVDTPIWIWWPPKPILVSILALFFIIGHSQIHPGGKTYGNRPTNNVFFGTFHFEDQFVSISLGKRLHALVIFWATWLPRAARYLVFRTWHHRQHPPPTPT